VPIAGFVLEQQVQIPLNFSCGHHMVNKVKS
jgi:hypothetical protein